MLILDIRLNKAVPTKFLNKFLQQYNSISCKDKFVTLDQGCELHRSETVWKVFSKHGYKILPTGAGVSHQQPCQTTNRTQANAICSFLIGANLPSKSLCCQTGQCSSRQGHSQSLISIVTGAQDDLTGLKTFGCQVLVKLSTRRLAKFKYDARKGILLGFMPQTLWNILWYDVLTG